jgi:hypothetical protein
MNDIVAMLTVFSLSYTRFVRAAAAYYDYAVVNVFKSVAFSRFFNGERED